MSISFPTVSPDQCLLTCGLETTSSQVTSFVAMGLPADAGPTPAASAPVLAPPTAQDAAALAAYTPSKTNTLDGKGTVVTPQWNPGAAGAFDYPTDAINHTPNPGLTTSGSNYDDMTYTGSDLKVMLEVAGSGSTPGSVRLSKRLAELTTITVSVHRVKSPVPACGYINTKGWARGRRTIAGTMVFTKFLQDVLAEFLTSAAFTSDLSKDSQYVKVDQLPPFNLTFLFSNEYGHQSYQRLIGVEFVTSGDVYSIQDMLSEQTVSYVCADFTPLLPSSQNSQHVAAASNPITAAQRTVADVLNASATRQV